MLIFHFSTNNVLGGGTCCSQVVKIQFYYSWRCVGAYLFESLSMRTRMVEFNNVLKAYIPNSPSNDRKTSSAIANASLSHDVPASEIPLPPSPSTTFERKKRENGLKNINFNHSMQNGKNHSMPNTYIGFSLFLQIIILKIIIVHHQSVYTTKNFT